MNLINFDKQKIREQLTRENIFELLTDFGGDPEYTSFGLLCSTICHNFPGEGSRKLYWYQNTGLLRCYTGCAEPTFDIFELVIKVFSIQQSRDLDLNDAVRYVAAKFGISGEYEEEDLVLSEDWKVFDSYSRVKEVELKDYSVELKEYDDTILKNLNYNILIGPWLDEGMTQEVLDYA